MPEKESETQTTPSSEEEFVSPDEIEESNERGEEAQEAEAPQGETAGEEAHDGTPKQNRAQNAEYAKRRREAEAKEKAEREKTQERLRREAELKGYIQGSGGTNHYIGQPIEDEEDKHLYELMKKADADGKDPIKEAYRMLREERIEAAKKAREEAEIAKQAEEAKKARAAKADENIRELAKKHPEANAEWFKREWSDKDSRFKDLVLHGYTPIQAYEFLGLGSKAPKAEAQPKESTPSTVPSGNTQGRKSVKDMTLDEVEALLKAEHGGL